MDASLATKYMSIAVRDRRHNDETDAERIFRNIVTNCRRVVSNF